MNNNDLYTGYSSLVSMLINNCTLKEFADALSEIVRSPAAVLDSKLHLIASSEIGRGSYEWKSLAKNKSYRSFKVLSKFSKDKLYCTEPATHPESSYKYAVFVPIFADNVSGELQGTLYLLSSSETFPDDYAILLQFASKGLSWYLWRYTHSSRQSNTSLNLLLTELLNGNKSAEKYISEAIAGSGFNFNRSLSLIVVELSASDRDAYSLDYLQNLFEGTWRDSFSFNFSSDLLIIVPSDSLSESTGSEELSLFKKHLSDCNCYAGYSGRFGKIDSLFMNHYIRALTAARTARRLYSEGSFVSYDSVALYNLVLFGPPPVSLKQLCDPRLVRLVEYDAHYGTEYVYTLCCYWKLNRNIPRICSYMHLHRNTLYYRISKLSELLDQDINNYDNFIQLSLSLNILLLYGDIPRYDFSDIDLSDTEFSD